MKTWDWSITGPLRAYWAFSLNRRCRGQVKARTKSEARAKVKTELGVDRLPCRLIVY